MADFSHGGWPTGDLKLVESNPRTDTLPEIEERVHQMLMARSLRGTLPDGRGLLRGRARHRHRLAAQDLPPLEFKRRLYERIYGEPAPF